jgi:predicted nuclease of predicted toxin-antitoxin system
MARLYTNENFRRRIVEALRGFGHDVLTSFEAGNANLSIPDDQVLDFARANDRIVLTFNRKDFIRLHYQNPVHPGIVVCTDDKDNLALAQRIHDTILSLNGHTENLLIRVNRPNKV